MIQFGCAFYARQRHGGRLPSRGSVEPNLKVTGRREVIHGAGNRLPGTQPPPGRSFTPVPLLRFVVRLPNHQARNEKGMKVRGGGWELVRESTNQQVVPLILLSHFFFSDTFLPPSHHSHGLSTTLKSRNPRVKSERFWSGIKLIRTEEI